MPIERAADHPTFELAGNAITSLAAPARGSEESALFRIDLPARGALQAHHHDHFDVFTVTAGSVSIHIEDDVSEVGVGDAVVVPPEAVHSLEAGPDGASLVVTMLGFTKLVRQDDGSVRVPPWVS